MDKTYYKIQNKTATSADVLIYGVIGDSWYSESVTAKRFVSDFKNLEKECSRINVRINSPGGSVFDGLAIFNAIQNSSVEVHTYNDGLAASMGGVILLAGKTVHSAKNALLMLHSPLTGVYGTARDIQNCLTVLEKVKDSLVTCICSKSGATSRDVENKYFDFEDHWLSAEEAKTEKFIDEIEERDVNVPKDIAGMKFLDIVSQFEELVKPEPKKFNVLSWWNNFFNNKTDEMNLTELIKVCNLDAKATEADVLEHIKNLISGQETLKTDKAKLDGDLKAERDAHAETKRELDETKIQVENLKKGPGAESPEVSKAVDEPKDEQVDNFLTEKDVEIFNHL